MNDPGPQVLVLNGGSSSGKTTLARSLQDVLDGYWLRLGVDTLIDAAPPRLLGPDGLEMAEDGTVSTGPDFAEVERQWASGVARMAVAGARVVVEDNFISGPVAQQRWREALWGLNVGWVGVRCASDVVRAREAARPDRIPGMGANQADSVHHGIAYDIMVDTGATDARTLALAVRTHFWDAAETADTSGLEPGPGVPGEPDRRLHVGGRTFTVDSAASRDVPAIVALLHDDPIGAGRESGDLGRYQEAWQQIEADRRHLLAVVRDRDDQVVGTMQLTLLPGLSRGAATRLQIEAVRVSGASRAGGLGTAMLEWAADWGRAHGATLAQLTTDKRRDDARRFYERLGYVDSHEGMKFDLRR